MIRILAIGLFFVVARVAQAQEEARVSANGSLITIVARNVQHRIVLPPKIRVDMDTAEVLDSEVVGDVRYLLLTVNGPSKRKGFGMGQCGAGFETAIVWLQLRAWRIVSSQFKRVESCWDNAMITDTVTWDGSVMQLGFLDIAAGSKPFVLRYDRNYAERGFVIAPGVSPR